MKVSFLEKKNNNLIFTGVYMEIYVPEYYIKSKLASYNGDTMSTYGILTLRYTNNPNKTDLSKEHLYTMSIPAKIGMKPVSTETRVMSLNGQPSERYTVLKFYKGNVVIASLDMIQLVDNVETMFINLLSKAKMPNTMSYVDGFKAFLDSYEYNGLNAGVNAMTLGLVYSELNRWKEKPEIPFRMIAGRENANMKDFIRVNMREVTKYASTFASITFEDINTMLINGVNKKRYNKTETYSPLEDLIH